LDIATLGIGVSIKKSPLTGKFRWVNPTMDLISMRAFTKIKVRASLEAERFTHWLPLYFGESEDYKVEKEHYDHDLDEHVKEIENKNMKERFHAHFMSSIAFIINGNKHKKVTDDQILDFIPKLLTTHSLAMMDESRHVSIVAIRRLFNFIRIIRYLIQKFPGVTAVIDQKLEQFINNP